MGNPSAWNLVKNTAPKVPWPITSWPTRSSPPKLRQTSKSVQPFPFTGKSQGKLKLNHDHFLNINSAETRQLNIACRENIFFYGFHAIETTLEEFSISLIGFSCFSSSTAQISPLCVCVRVNGEVSIKLSTTQLKVLRKWLDKLTI